MFWFFRGYNLSTTTRSVWLCASLGVVSQPADILPETSQINTFTHSLTNPENEIENLPHEHVPLSEFNTPYLASMAFPSLFPTGAVDPYAITNGDRDTHLNKVKNLLNYAERVENELDCRFA